MSEREVKEFEYTDFGSKSKEPELLTEQKCYFCKSSPILSFQEKFIFCPECAALYLFQSVKSTCDHINSFVPVLIRHPWINKDVDKPFIYRQLEKETCSECDAEVWVN